ncbi:MAG: hypothetical protein AAGA81_10435 [Acidobacteriota bacterium]
MSKLLCLALVPAFGCSAILFLLARESTFGDSREYVEVPLSGTDEQLQLFDGNWWIDGYLNGYQGRPDIRVDSSGMRARVLAFPGWEIQSMRVEDDRLSIFRCRLGDCREMSWELVGEDEAWAEREGLVGGCANGFAVARANPLERIWRRGRALFEDVREGHFYPIDLVRF